MYGKGDVSFNTHDDPDIDAAAIIRGFSDPNADEAGIYASGFGDEE